MVVSNYNVQTSSQHTSLSISSTTMLATRNLGAPRNTSSISAPQQEPSDTVQISTGKLKKPNRGVSAGHLKQMYRDMQDNSLKQLSARRKPKRVPKQNKAQYSKTPSDPAELRRQMLEMMFELILGKSSSTTTGISTESGFSLQSESSSFSMSITGGYFGFASDAIESGEAAGATRTGWKLERFNYESEMVSYQAKGVINTADGRSINVDINMQLSRQYTEYLNIDVEVTRNNLCDPLVINYGGTAASLTGEKFSFDLTSDGNNESIAVLAQGSGFLALDKNGDGKINDGNELFGPNSGCGFSELREYDKDRNGWIDEADDIFDKLLVWSKDANGRETSYTLKELGIGAIYLGDISTEFTFKDDSNQVLGVMRSTSFFLKEDGGAGTLSHIDLAV